MKAAVIILLCILSFQNKVCGQQHPLIQIERHWVKAIQNKDTVFLNRLLSDDFTDVSWKGSLRYKKDLLHFSNNSAASERLSALQERIYGNAGIVNGLNTITIPGHLREISIRFTDVFIKKDNEWHVVSAQESLVQ
jgi:hypothetical protein